MNAIKATVMQGGLELKVPLDWPDGTEVLIEPTTAPLEKIGIDESQWRDDPESLADLEAWIKTIEPLENSARDEQSRVDLEILGQVADVPDPQLPLSRQDLGERRFRDARLGRHTGLRDAFRLDEEAQHWDAGNHRNRMVFVFVILDEPGKNEQVVVLVPRQRSSVAQAVDHGDRSAQLGLRADRPERQLPHQVQVV